MEYNFGQIRDKIAALVKEAAFSPENKFTSTVWGFHVLPVVRHSLALGRKMKADLEILELSALLHDYACFVNPDFYKNHHIHGAELAEAELKKVDFPEEKIKHIKSCILSHRGSVGMEKKTIEAEILASADAMAHITELADMFYLAYGVHKFQTLEGAKWLKGKFERSWNKIMPEGRELVKADYDLAMGIIEKALKKQGA